MYSLSTAQDRVHPWLVDRRQSAIIMCRYWKMNGKRRINYVEDKMKQSTVHAT